VEPKCLVHQRTTTLTRESAPSSRRRAVSDIVLYGVCGGALIAVLKLTEYRFLIVEQLRSARRRPVCRTRHLAGADAHQKEAAADHQSGDQCGSDVHGSLSGRSGGHNALGRNSPQEGARP